MTGIQTLDNLCSIKEVDSQQITKLVSCHRLTKIKNSTVILICQSLLVNYYLAKCFVVLEHKSKRLFIVTNHLKPIIHANDKQKLNMLWRIPPQFTLYEIP